MSKPIFISQLLVVLILAGASAWLGQQWRHEAVEYQTRKESDGGIEKQRLVSEGEKRKAEIIADFEAVGAALRGTIDGQSVAESTVIDATGETAKTATMSSQTRSVSYAVDTLQGIRVAVVQFERLAATESGDLGQAYSKIAAYLQRVALNQEQMRRAAWGSSDVSRDCPLLETTSRQIAIELLARVK